MVHQDYITRSNLRLRTLVRLRWIAIFGQLLTVLVVYFGLGFSFPLLIALVVIGLSVVANFILLDFFKSIRVLGNQFGTWLLGFDIVQLAFLLFLTGGILNPFACLLVAPVALSAASLRTQSTMVLGALAVGIATFISFVYMPLPWDTPSGLEFPIAYRIGNWISVLCAMTFIGFFAWRIANESRIMSAALAATEASLAREQQLSAIDGLAAAAAHGLGTPLSTITLVAKELERDLPSDSVLKEDVKLIKEQAGRCREILQSLTDVGEEGDVLVSTSSIGEVLEEVAQPFKALNSDIEIIAQASNDAKDMFLQEPVLRRNAGMMHALSNIVENAVEFASEKVIIKASWDEKALNIKISDDGPGFSSEMLKVLGEPFISSRSMTKSGKDGDFQGGMGLGFFISKTLLERSGALIRYGNNKFPERGAFITLKWPRQMIDENLRDEQP